MNCASDPRLDGYDSIHGTSDSYEPSIASSHSTSSQASVFSDVNSAHSSIATSISDDFRSIQDDARDRDDVCARAQLRVQAQHGTLANEGPCHLSNLLKLDAIPPTYAAVTSVPAQQRQHPRRSSSARGQPPPSLVRQRDRKITFVDNLVDSATQMIEVIWPSSASPRRATTNNGRCVLPLRTYIEETLRRSRTSYSTLQVTLYYLVLIKPHIPKADVSLEQRAECAAYSALTCGRRIFLAALILASKYLQDRNYSAKAWSKMSGLKVAEINANERVFLAKINWRLHIPKPIFEQWQGVVLRFTPQPPPSPDSYISTLESAWKKIILILTPELDTLPPMDPSVDPDPLPLSAGPTFDAFTPPTPSPCASSQMSVISASQESTPTPATVFPRDLETQPEMNPPTPALVRMGPLPTPQMTPSTVGSSTPAASACNSRRTSICSAMALARRASLNRCTLDVCPTSLPSDLRQSAMRRPSLASSVSYGSSPESLLTDYARSSRSSSISSVSTVSTTSSMAPFRACLARQATCRNVRMHLPSPLKESAREGSAAKPIIIDDEVGLVSSPEMADFSVTDKSLHMPHRHSKHAPHIAPAPNTDKGRKRCRSRGYRRSELHEEVRFLLQESLDDAMDIDEHYTSSPSPAANYTSDLLSDCNTSIPVTTIQTQDSLSPFSHRRESLRVAVQKEGGKKRTCCSADTMSMSPAPLAV